MTDPVHPTDDVLVKLAEGRLLGPELEQLENHLDSCGACRTLLAVVSNGSAPSAAIERATLSPGEKLGRYEIERLIGAGGMGMLYVARDPQLGRRVALKLMRPAFNDELGRVRLLREAQAMAQLSHPNVVHVYELGELSGRVFIAMELLEGGTLRDWMKTPRIWRDVLSMFVVAGEGLYAAHQSGVVHRDFKPENVMLGKDGRPRVGDFGLARPELVAEEEPPLHPPMRITQVGTMLGTPAYMSPEQLTGKPADALSDQYGFCVALYEALAGKRPFPTDSVAELRQMVLGGMPPPPKDGPVPAHVWAAVARGLHPDPAKRFSNLGELLMVLRLGPEPLMLPKKRSRVKIAQGIAIAAFATTLLTLIATKVPFGPLSEKHAAAPLQSTEQEAIALPTFLRLAPGRSETFLAQDVTRIAVGNVKVANLELAGNGRLRVMAIAAGTTSMLLWDSAGRERSVGVSVVEGGAPWAHEQRLTLKPGETSLAFYPGLERVLSGNVDVLEVRRVGTDGVLLTARKPGTSPAWYWLAGDHRVLNVVTVDAQQVAEPAAAAPEPEPEPAPQSAAVAEEAHNHFLPATLALDKGESRTLKARGLKRIAVGDSSIVDIKTVGADQLVLTGADDGRSTVLAWFESGRESMEVEVRPKRHAEANTGNVSLAVGSQKVLTAHALQRVAIGDSAIADVKTIGDDQLLVIGVGEGKTTLITWDQQDKRTSYLISVHKAAPVPGIVSVWLQPGYHQLLPGDDYLHVTSDAPAVVSVVSDGDHKAHLEAQASGKATVTAEHTDGTKTLYKVDVHRDRATVALEEAQRAIAAKDFKNAEVALKACLDSEAASIDCTVTLADVEVQLGHLDVAASLYQRYLGLAPVDHPRRTAAERAIEELEKNKKP